MTREVKIIETKYTQDSIYVEAEIDGDYIAHPFPRDIGMMEEDPDTGRPRFVEPLIKLYDKKQEDNEDEEECLKIDNSLYDDKVFTVD